MMKKKVIAIAGASIVTVALSAGVTYAWFTNTQIKTAAQITAGKFGIEFQLKEAQEESIPIFPQLTLVDSEGNELPDPEGIPENVATSVFTLQNVSDRQALVKVSGTDLLANGVNGSELDEDKYVVKGSYPTELTDTDAVKIRCDFGNTAEIYRKGNDAYILLPAGYPPIDITVQVWIDGETSGNEYQYATINLNALTATAVQYRKAAITATFSELLESDLAEIEKFGAFE